jgi:hypothetical protein
MPKVLSLVSQTDGLAGKLDKLASSLADELLGPDVAVAEKIAGLKALAAYQGSRRSGEAVKNAFDGYRAALAEGDGDDDAA